MARKIGLLGVSHMHVFSYAHYMKHSPRVELVGFYEPETERANKFATDTEMQKFDSIEQLVKVCDGVVICGTNVQHREMAEAAFAAGCHVLSEKPIATTLADADAMIAAGKAAKRLLMVGFPCRFSPAYQSLKGKIQSGAIGTIKALNTTNRGTCPFDWFVDKSKSGGGAMIDHVVHVADLLLDLLGEEPENVQAFTGNNMYSQDWEDTAMLSLQYPSGVFATLDSSWSRPKTFKTWGDVTMTAVGTDGLIEMDMFGQTLDRYSLTAPFGVASFGSDLDGAMIAEFLNAMDEERLPIVTGEHGRAALRVALMGYESLARVPATAS